ncbi:unnamed protein product [Hymenolepis diminuta]|uniref:Uncharacterized protein n=1 Tax=Hymenolepis diminuta TaxID=6216 RepID=A0A564YB41_HYMDI|nr:unnamed protein product [Hymenolepis diminuta]
MFNSPSTEVKALSVKSEGSKHVSTFITTVSSVPSSCSIKPSPSVEVPIMQLLKMSLKCC